MDNYFNIDKNTIDLFLNTPRKKGTKIVAEKLKNNIISPFPGLDDTKFDESFSWNMKYKKQTNTYQIYLQGMSALNKTLSYYSIDNDIEYITKSKVIFEDWLDYIDEGKVNSMTWADHTVATRTIVIIKLLYFFQRTDIEFEQSRYKEILEKHASILMDDSFHKKNNHGLMLDRALILLGLAMNNESYYLKGYERAKSIFWLSFSDKGVHLENSPEYHNMVYKMFIDIEAYLSKNERTFGKEIKDKLHQIKEYRGILLKPDRRFPAIGDSSHVLDQYKTKMIWEDFHDSTAGLSILKHKENLFYLAFICGYSNITHKQSDDLSFLLNYNSKDFFSDPGKYKYSSDKYRRYIVSKKAHTRFSVENIIYKKSNDNRYTKNVYTDHFLSTKLFSLVSGYMRGENELFLRRSLYYIPQENVLIGFDKGHSYRNEQWTQRFNLSESVSINEIGENHYELINTDSSIFLNFFDNEPTEIVNSRIKANWPVAFNSPSPGKIVKTHQIMKRVDDKADFFGGFYIALGNDKKVDVVSKEYQFDVSVNGQMYVLPRVD